MGARRRLTACCCLALFSFSAACKKHQRASIPAPAPTAPARVSRPRRAQNPPAATPSPPAPGVPAEGPRLGQILPATEQRRYNALIDQSLISAQSSLQSLGNRPLNADQQNSLREIQEFMRQAEVTRKVDLIAANALAGKAQVLARDLAASVH